MAIALFTEGTSPTLFLIPSFAWQTPNLLFVGRDYQRLKSKPEWGLNLSQKNLETLNQYRFEETVNHLCNFKA